MQNDLHQHAMSAASLPIAPARPVRLAVTKAPTVEHVAEINRFGELDAYRGIAALLLVLFHTYTMTSASWGQPLYQPTVDNFLGSLRLTGWFFTLSGFLLFLPFARAAIEQSGRRSVRGFLVRRALRIIPLYYLVLGVMWPLHASRSADPAQDLLHHLTFMHIFDDRYAMSIILPAWSLAVEVVFYGFLAAFGPLIYLLGGRCATRRGRITLITTLLGLLGILSVGYKCYAYFWLGVPSESLTVYSGPLAKADTFALGMVLAVILVGSRVRLSGWWPLGLLLSGLGIMAALIVLRESNDMIEIAFHELSSVAFVLILASTVLATCAPPWKRGLLCPTLQYLGRISYSIYLWHELVVIVLLTSLRAIGFRPIDFPLLALAVLLCAIGLATMSYRLVERPAVRLGQRFTRAGVSYTRE